MADKRPNEGPGQQEGETQLADFDLHLCLGRALQVVVTYGEAVLRDDNEEGRHTLWAWLRRGFPGDRFSRWTKKEIRDMPWCEERALLSALRELVEGQFRRVRTSGHIADDPLRLFMRLYRKELRLSTLSAEGQSEGKRVPRRPIPEQRPADSPEEEGLPRQCRGQAEATSHDLEDEVVDGAFPSQETDDDEEALGPWSPAFALLSKKLPSWGLDPDSCPARSLLAAWSEQPAEWVRTGFLGPFAWPSALLDEELVSFLEPSLMRKLSGAGLRAFRAAVEAIMCRGASWHSRRGNSLSAYLTPAQMHALRRECQQHARIGAFLRDLSRRVTGIRERAARSRIGEEPYYREKIPRRRLGDAFLDLAKEAEEGGLSEVAAGLRAADKRRWGLDLTEEEFASVQVARLWVTGPRRKSVLDQCPDPQEQWNRLLRDGSENAARDFAQYSLRLALFCWPEGIPQSPSPTPPQPE